MLKKGMNFEGESDLPSALAKPAKRALVQAGIYRLEQLTKVSEAQLLQLHGMGPKAVGQLKTALAELGMCMAQEN
ncbi:DNA-binding protein [Brevibacillus nitrificans]|uniref:DNA-binding protein n=1 Tax=Brevibacillus nitrificans TaxID=651560 RepID=UPI002864B240|nr:DNA-binding protein [Brevibacillus nitrificans]MDR7314570.1 DNA-directed RNA polymerase alpha subunit [Brevibacillus nitrificans]